MGRRSYEQEFPKPVKRAVKEDQEGRCFYCNGLCRGHAFGEPNLEVHHVIPVSQNGLPVRENAVGLCDHRGNDCHHRFDQLYFKEQKTVFEVLLEEGRWYDLSQHPGNPYGRKSVSGD